MGRMRAIRTTSECATTSQAVSHFRQRVTWYSVGCRNPTATRSRCSTNTGEGASADNHRYYLKSDRNERKEFMDVVFAIVKCRKAYPAFANNSRPISMRLISLVPAPIS